MKKGDVRGQRRKPDSCGFVSEGGVYVFEECGADNPLDWRFRRPAYTTWRYFLIKGQRKCTSLHILPKERSNTDLAIIGKSPKIHVRIGDSILYAAKLEFHINIGIARVLIISLLPHNRGWHFGGAGDLGINRSGHVSRHADEGGASIDSTSRGLAAG